MYFIGVTTGQSSINRVFPRWAETLGLGDAALVGMDFVPHDAPGRYREAVAFIKDDPLSLGALVTTHKMDLFSACGDQFDSLDEVAMTMGEVSSLYKRQGRLYGRPVDHITGGLALGAFLPTGYWASSEAEVCILGAGGSSVALSLFLTEQRHGDDCPSRIVITNRSPERLEHLRSVHQRLGTSVPLEYHHCPEPAMNDAVVSRLAPGSLVANATGLGKDAPGSPLTDAAVFPRDGFAWEFNYRGDLLFLDQAKAQAAEKHLHIEDGWIYFLHGWTRVMADVFDVDIPTSGAVFDQLSTIAAENR